MKKYFKIKRSMDLIFSLIALLLLLPWILILSILIKLDSSGTVLFKQKRIGKDQVPFNILKFRTMKKDTPKDTPTHMLKEANTHVTKVGKFLRSSSLDELPQLLNIIKGEMSMVGPRPALWTQKDLIEERENLKINDIPPGITGWAQVNGRDELSIKLKVHYDNEYKKNVSFKTDAVIIIKTIFNVVKKQGIREGAHK